MPVHEIEEKIIKLETKLAFVEDFLMQLQEVSVEQGKEIEMLKKENKKIHGKIKEILENEELLNQKPPHY
jgi:SlyX protein